MQQPRILIVDSLGGDGLPYARLSARLQPFEVRVETSLDRALATLSRDTWDLGVVTARSGPTADVLLAALRANGWRREPTARQLGIAVSSLYGLIDRCALLRKANEISRDELERCREACQGDLAAMSAKLEVSTRGLQLRMRELGMV